MILPMENTEKMIFPSVGKYGIPAIKPETDIRIDKLEWISVNYALTAKDKAMSESQKRTQFERMDRVVDKAVSFTSAYDKKQSAQNRLSELQKAKKQVSGTGKTQSELAAKAKNTAKKNALKSSESLKWKTTNKGGYTADGGYMSKEISAGSYKIRGSSGVFRIYDGSKQIGGASKLSDAKAFVEVWRKKKR